MLEGGRGAQEVYRGLYRVLERTGAQGPGLPDNAAEL